MSNLAIICVDDEPLMLRSLKHELRNIFKDQQDILIETAESGYEAIDLIASLHSENYEIPLVISDYIMPAMRGDEFLRHVHEFDPRILKILLTGQTTIEALSNAVNYAHLYRYISKPLDTTDFRLTVLEAMRSYQSKRELALFYLDLEKKVQERTLELSNTNQLLAQEIEQHHEAKLALQETVEKLTALNQEKNEFLGIVAHDLKNPLSAIKGFAEVIAEEAEPLQEMSLVEYANLIGESATFMSELITNLLDVNRIESGKISLHLKELDFVKVLQQIVDNYRERAHKKSIEFQCNIQDCVPLAIADEQALRQVLDNLVSNAVKYSRLNTQVSIHLYTDNHHLYCKVADQGAGLSEKDIEKLFGKYHRLSAKPTAGESSTGLGLYIVKKLVDAMGGKISCQSRLGEGCEFTLQIGLKSVFSA